MYIPRIYSNFRGKYFCGIYLGKTFAGMLRVYTGYLWPPYVIGQAIYILILWFLLLLFFSPNLSGRRLDVYHTSTHGVVLV